jgi:hypothetical protein
MFPDRRHNGDDAVRRGEQLPNQSAKERRQDGYLPGVELLLHL